jgi:hypothetical protein
MKSHHATVFFRYNVKVYDNWRKVHDYIFRLLKEKHVNAYAIYQAADNPLDVTVVYDFAKADHAIAFANDAEIRRAMESEVNTPPTIWVAYRVWLDR